MAQVLQGLLLFFVLACDTLILYRIRLVRTRLVATETARA
jgi:simple sugar transport system permease protein